MATLTSSDAIIKQSIKCLLYKNVAETVEKEISRRKKKRALTARERNALDTAEFDDVEKLLAYFLLYTGVRRQELIPLTKFDVDMCKGLGSHTFRHEFATMLYYSGIDLMEAVEMMGHANSQMILDTYAELRKHGQSSADKLNLFLKKTEPKRQYDDHLIFFARGVKNGVKTLFQVPKPA